MDIQTASTVLAALGNDHRLKLWRMLLPTGDAGLSAGSIAEQLSIPPSTLSFHLSQMTGAGLLKKRRHSRAVVYAIMPGIMNELLALLQPEATG